MATRLELEAILQLGEFIGLIAVEEAVVGIGIEACHLGLQTVEITALGAETAVEIETVAVDIVRHGGLEVGDKAVELALGHTDEFKRQRHGVEEDILLLVDVPVEGGDVDFVLTTGLDIERLTVILNLEEHQRGVVGIAMEFEVAVLGDDSAVHQFLDTGEHVAVTVQLDGLAGTALHLAADSDIDLRRERGSQCPKAGTQK